MQDRYEVSVEKWNQILESLSNDNLSLFVGLFDVNMIDKEIRLVIPPPAGGHRLVAEKRKTTPILICAIDFDALKCAKWLLEHGANPNARNGLWTALMIACYCSMSDYRLLTRYGALVKIPDELWPNIYKFFANGEAGSYPINIMLSRMFLLGLKIPPHQLPDIPSVCGQVYDILRMREAACRQACYAFLMDGRLPRDLARWLLSTFVLPTKRESTWSPLNVKMPKGFELLD